MSKKTKTLLIIAVVLILAVLYWWFAIFRPPEYYARQNWNNICEKIDSGMIVSSVITGHSTGPQEIDIDDCLSPEDFDWFLPKEMSPPTPYYVITIKFSDNSEVNLYNWDYPDFSIYYREQYSVFVNEELFSRIQSIYGTTE